VDKTVGSFGPEAVGRASGPGQLIASERSPKAALFALFAFQVFRMALFFGSAYNYYNHNVGTAWLLGIIFVHSFLDSKFYMKPNLMNAYLAFTVIFYYCRWVMGWGSPLTTIYKEDAPAWVRALKDVVWIGFLAIVGIRALSRPRFDRNMPLWFTARGMALVLLALIYLTLPTLALLYARGSVYDILLVDLRFPLEYVPIIFLFPFILAGGSSLKYLRTFIPLVVLSLLFLGVERFSGRMTGFGGTGYWARYGSIFGSPNDFGLFMMLAIAALLAFLTEKALRWSFKTIVLLAACLVGLASTISLSAVMSAAFTAIALIFFAKNKVKGALSVVGVVALLAGLYFAFPEAGVSRYLTARLEKFTNLADPSTFNHWNNIVTAQEAISRFEPGEYLVGTFKSRETLMLPETYYLRTLYVRGGASLLILLSIMSLTLLEAHRRYRAALGDRMRRGLFLTAFLGVAGVAFACLFIPYLETFPSNFYFWFLVAIIWCEPMNERERVEFRASRPLQHVTAGKAIPPPQAIAR